MSRKANKVERHHCKKVKHTAEEKRTLAQKKRRSGPSGVRRALRRAPIREAAKQQRLIADAAAAIDMFGEDVLEQHAKVHNAE